MVAGELLKGDRHPTCDLLDRVRHGCRVASSNGLVQTRQEGFVALGNTGRGQPFLELRFGNRLVPDGFAGSL